ncbi:MAG: hypothetical protein J5582_14420 [Ruminococcus sp.]|uniref:hypothetical protein n=1 Tax=Ruminococcus sp. TaxID=41978 RepID=UPI0025FB5DC2|nr:hypothetical protein [Ruminococcus sp.]MBO4867732.1 hypothetical protein [Ruminococcus sp.]
MKRKIIIAVIILIFTACVAYVVYISSPMVRMTVAYKLNAELFEKAASGDEEDIERLVDKLSNTDGFRPSDEKKKVSAFWNEEQERLYITGYREGVESSAGGKELRYGWVYSETKPDIENKEMSSFRLEKTLGDGWYLYRWLGYIC